MQKISNGSEGEACHERLKTEQVYNHLKSYLVFQNVPPRTKLDQKILAQRLKVSITPIREALILLVNEGILSHSPGGGYFSKPLDFAEVVEDYEVALGILKHLIAKDVTSFTEDGLQVPDGSYSPSNELATFEPHARFIEHLYERVGGLAGNRRSLRLIKAFNARSAFIRQLDLKRPDRFDRITMDMTEFLDRLSHHDSKGAINNLEQQFNLKAEILYELVKEGNLRALSASDTWDIRLRSP